MAHLGTNAAIRRIAIVLVATTSLLALVCIGTIATLRSRATLPANASAVVSHYGRFAVSLEVSEIPQCSRLMVSCVIVPDSLSGRYFTLWVAVTASGDEGQQTTVRRILKLPVP